MILQFVLLLLWHYGSASLNATELRTLVKINHCGDSELCRNSTQYRGGIQCQCDPDCSKYGDCCRDSPFFHPEDCFKKICKAAFNATSRLETYVSMIGSCPRGWNKNSTVRAYCQSPKILDGDPFASGIPLTDTSTATPVTYRNAYCAICNNANLASLKTWNAKLTCSKKNNKQPQVKPELVWRDKDKKWHVSAEEVLYPCHDLTPILPSNLEVRRCPRGFSRYIDQCDNDWENTTDATLCQSYTAYVFHIGKTYQNVYCAQCHKVEVNATTCHNPDETFTTGDTIGYGDYISFQELLNFELEVTSCRQYEVYDPFKKRCRPLLQISERIETRLGEAPKNRRVCITFVSINETYIFAHDNESVWIPAHNKSYERGEFIFKDDMQLAVCLQDSGVTGIKVVEGVLTYVGLGISVVFLTLHLCAFALVAELRNLSGRTLASLCVSLLLGYISFIGGGFLTTEDYPFCRIISIVIYYFFLSAFTWMLVIAFDVWRALVQAIHFQSCRGGQWQRFFAYSAFAWLTPAIMTSLAIAADNTPSNLMNEDLRPGFGERRCWFSHNTSLMIFFAAPLTLIMALNVGFFTSAAWMTMETRPCGMSAGASGARRDFRLYFRLAVMVGLTWVVGLLANVLNYAALWFAFVVLNTLQGLFIFVMFTCTAKVFQGLEKAMPWTESFRFSLSSLRERRSTKTQSTYTGVSSDISQDKVEQNPEVRSLYPKNRSIL